MYTIIMNWNEAGKITDINNRATQAEAEALIAAVSETFPNAFAFESDECWRSPKHWIVDPQTQTASYVPPPPAVPQRITPLQARKALRAAGLMAAVQAFIATQPDEVQDEWEYAITIERSNTTLTNAATALGLTEAQVDALFIAGASM